SGAKGIVTCALDPNAYTPALQQAQQEHVPVVLVDCDVSNPSLRAGYVGTVGATFGAKTATHLEQVSPKGGNVLVMETSFDVQIQNQIYQGFAKTLARKKGWTISAREADNSD